MEMRGARLLGMCGLVVVALGCSKVSKDSSKVLANVGGEKITENSFAETVHAIVGDDVKANDLLKNPALKDQRNQFLAELVDQKVMTLYGQKQGLDKDLKVKLLIEAARSNAYGQVLMERSIPQPTEAEMRAFYDDVAGKAKAAGQTQGLPPYEAVKDRIAQSLKQKKAQEASQKLLDSAKSQVPSTIDPAWRSAPAPAMAMPPQGH